MEEPVRLLRQYRSKSSSRLGSRERICRNFTITLVLTACLAGASALGQTPAQRHVRLQQEMLIWTTEYDGLIDGVAGAGTVEAIKRFQARMGNAVTGQLTQPELAELIKQGTMKR